MRTQQRPPRWLRNMLCENRQMGCFSHCKAKLFCKCGRRAYCCVQVIVRYTQQIEHPFLRGAQWHDKKQLQPCKTTVRSITFNVFGVELFWFLMVGILFLFFFPYQVSGQILEVVFRRSCEISFFGDFQSSVGDGSEQSAQTVPALSVCIWQRGFALSDLKSFLGI